MNWMRILQWKTIGRLISVAGAVAGDFIRRNASSNSFEAKTVIANVQQYTTAGWAATETITIAGVLATDVVLATLHTEGSVARTIVRAEAKAGEVDIEFSDDPSTDHIVNLLVIRP